MQRRVACAFLLATMLLVSAKMARCAECNYEELGFPGWLVVNSGFQLSLAIPTSSVNNVEDVSLGGTVAAGVRFVNGFLLMLDYAYSGFDGQASTTSFIKKHQFLVRTRYAIVSSYYLDWFIGFDVGLSMAVHRYFRAQLDAEGQPIYVLDPRTNQNIPMGTTLETSFAAASGGAGTRLSVYPTQWLGIFLDVRADYTYHPDFGEELAPLNLHISTGLEGHF